MKKDLLDNLICNITKVFKKCYIKIMELLGVTPSTLYNKKVIFIDKTLLSTNFRMEVFRLFIKQNTNCDCVYDLSKYKYIHSLSRERNSYIDDSLFPDNLYDDISKNKCKYAICLFDTSWVGDEKFDDMICELDLDDGQVLINSDNKKIDDMSFIYLDNLAGLFGTKLVEYENFFTELKKLL